MLLNKSRALSLKIGVPLLILTKWKYILKNVLWHNKHNSYVCELRCNVIKNVKEEPGFLSNKNMSKEYFPFIREHLLKLF